MTQRNIFDVIDQLKEFLSEDSEVLENLMIIENELASSVRMHSPEDQKHLWILFGNYTRDRFSGHPKAHELAAIVQGN